MLHTVAAHNNWEKTTGRNLGAWQAVYCSDTDMIITERMIYRLYHDDWNQTVYGKSICVHVIDAFTWHIVHSNPEVNAWKLSNQISKKFPLSLKAALSI